ncbi:hypothetical protein M1Y42_000790 [Listeria monocytogenes]|nr:hypothetical protein [Listeria monocytogenes]EJD3240022.1 hypothetical protein [Listeria monocytogenes]
MNRIILKADKKFQGSVKELKDLFERQVEDPNREIRFANSEASILWIIRGCINYFDTLPPDFLGCGNASGIPSDKADAFANNVYRLNNAMKYLSELWKLDYASGSAFKVLIDLRTLIVHSGERIIIFYRRNSMSRGIFSLEEFSREEKMALAMSALFKVKLQIWIM